MLRDLLPRKRFDEFLRGDRLCGVGQSCGAGECADDLLGCEFLPQETEVEVLIALGQAASVMVAQQRDMDEVRRREAEQLIQPDLARRTADEIVPAHDLGHAGQAVIHHDRQLIREHAVRPPDDEVAALLGERFGILAVHAVRECDGSLGHAHARCRRTLSALFGHLLGC